jgi:hypothetical protein
VGDLGLTAEPGVGAASNVEAAVGIDSPADERLARLGAGDTLNVVGHFKPNSF